MDEQRFEIDTPGARFDIQVVASGEIEIRTPDGQIAVTPKSSNLIHVQCVPMWSDQTAIKVVAHTISRGRAKRKDSNEISTQVVQTLRGRTNINKP